MPNESSSKFAIVIGLLRSVKDGVESYWVRWDHGIGGYVLPMGPRLQDESPVVTARREIAWTFALDPNRDLVVSSVPRLHLETTLRDGLGNRSYAIDFFVADVYGSDGRATVRDDDANRLAGRTALLASRIDGEPFDPVQSAFLREADVLPVAGSE